MAASSERTVTIRELPVFSTIGLAIQLLGRHGWALPRIAVPLLLMAVLSRLVSSRWGTELMAGLWQRYAGGAPPGRLEILGGSLPGLGSGFAFSLAIGFLAMAIFFFLFAGFCSTWLATILGCPPESRRDGWRRRDRFILWSVVLLLAMMVVGGIPLLNFYVGGRLLLVLPAAVRGDPHPFASGWNRSIGNGWRVTAVDVLCLVMLFPLSGFLQASSVLSSLHLLVESGAPLPLGPAGAEASLPFSSAVGQVLLGVLVTGGGLLGVAFLLCGLAATDLKLAPRAPGPSAPPPDPLLPEPVAAAPALSESAATSAPTSESVPLPESVASVADASMPADSGPLDFVRPAPVVSYTLGDLPVLGTIGLSFSLLARSLSRGFGLGMPVILFSLLAILAELLGRRGTPHGMLTLVSAVGLLATLIMFSTAWIRETVDLERARSGWRYRFGVAELLFIPAVSFSQLFLYSLVFGSSLTVLALGGALEALSAGRLSAILFLVPAGLVVLAVFMVALWFYARLVMVLPGLVRDGWAGVSRSWRSTEGNGFKIAAVQVTVLGAALLLLAPLAVGLAMLADGAQLSTKVANAVAGWSFFILGLMGWVVHLTALSACYRVLALGQAPADILALPSPVPSGGARRRRRAPLLLVGGCLLVAVLATDVGVRVWLLGLAGVFLVLVLAVRVTRAVVARQQEARAGSESVEEVESAHEVETGASLRSSPGILRRLAAPVFVIALGMAVVPLLLSGYRSIQISRLVDGIDLRERADQRILRAGSAAVPSLTALIEDRDRRAAAAAQHLGLMRSRAHEALPILLAAVEDGAADMALRREAAFAATRLGQRGVEAITALSHSSSVDTAEIAEWALGRHAFDPRRHPLERR